MKVRCIQNVIDDDLASKVGLPNGAPKLYRSVTPGKDYVVLGLSYSPSTTCYGGQPVVEIKNDTGRLSSIPLFLFTVLDNKASKYWHLRHNENGLLTLFPESFYIDFYHDDLSEGVTEIEKDFQQVCLLLENEQA